MSPKRKSGLHDSLSDIIKRQTAPISDKSKLSSNLLATFAEPRDEIKQSPVQDISSQAKADAPLSTTHHQSPPVVTPKPVAPERDYNKRANSLDRDAMPAGLFPGSTFKVYNALYIRTRGAIKPVTKVKASRRDLLTWTGIKNLKTIDNHVRYLMTAGLIIRHWELGSNEGASYEVRLPEEIRYHYPPLTTTPHQSPSVPISQETGSGYTQNLGSGGDSQTIGNKDTSESPKTSFKTNTIDDDEAFQTFNGILKEATRKLTGKPPLAIERERWAEVARAIVEELERAAARAETISSVPAFLAAHLRRRFGQKPAARREGKRAGSAADTQPAPASEPNPRLTAEQIAEQAQLISELIKSGYTLEQAEAQFAGGLHPKDWQAIRRQLEEKGTDERTT